MRDKIANAKNTTWPADGLADKEVARVIENARRGVHMNNSKWFGVVRWSKDDIVAALKDAELPVTKQNIAKLREIVSGDGFEEYMVQCGWEFMNNALSYGDWDTE